MKNIKPITTKNGKRPSTKKKDKNPDDYGAVSNYFDGLKKSFKPKPAPPASSYYPSLVKPYPKPF